jgi:hypothetical protein
MDTEKQLIPLQKLTAKYGVDAVIECCASNCIRPKVIMRQISLNPRPLTEKEKKRSAYLNPMFDVVKAFHAIPQKKVGSWRTWHPADIESSDKPIRGSKISSIAKKLVELPENIWLELSAIAAAGKLVFDEAVVDSELRKTWRLPSVMETVPFSPPMKIYKGSLSPLFISQEDLDILQPSLRLLERPSPSPAKSHLNSHQPSTKKPHGAYINQSILQECVDWVEAWRGFLKLANEEWIEIGEFRFRLTMLTRTIGKESVNIEIDDGTEYTLKRNAFRTNFGRLLKKSAH